MKHFLRPYQSVGIVVLMGMVAGACGARAQSSQVVELLEGTNPLLLRASGSQGYLGAYVEDVDSERAQTLKLKEVRGAVITLIDHDAPAGQIGLRVNDVVLQLNGQSVEGAEQLRRMLREIPAGRKVSLEFSRDGNVQTISVQLVDRRVMEKDVWNRLGDQRDVFAPTTGMGVLEGGGDASLPGMFHMPIFGANLNVGVIVEPLVGQTAEFLGLTNGLMVKQVVRKSEAAAAGLRAKDIILKVGPEAVTTLSDWDRMLRVNQGKPVQVTILRDGKQQTLTLQVDSKHKTGELRMQELFPNGACPLVAELDTDALQSLAPDALQLMVPRDEAAANALRDQAQELKDQVQGIGMVNGKISAEQAEEMRKQAEALRDQLKVDGFQFDQKQLDELKKQMDEFRKNFRPEDLQSSPN